MNDETTKFYVIYFDNVAKVDRTRYFDSFDEATKFIHYRIWYPGLYINFRIKAL